jgi:hypothetical protein
LLGDHDDVEPFLARFRDGGRWIDDAELGSVRADEPDLGESEDELVDGRVLRGGNAGAASEKCDGDVLLAVRERLTFVLGFEVISFREAVRRFS